VQAGERIGQIAVYRLWWETWYADNKHWARELPTRKAAVKRELVKKQLQVDGDFAIDLYFTDGEEQDWLLDLQSIRGRVLIWHVATRA
jgi:hypothetical protein